jgi:hypothetical protein
MTTLSAKLDEAFADASPDEIGKFVAFLQNLFTNSVYLLSAVTEQASGNAGAQIFAPTLPGAQTVGSRFNGWAASVGM